MSVRLTLAVALALCLAGPVLAHEVKAGDLTLSNLAIRAVPAGVPNTAGYLVITNAGSRPDKLLSASCPCARRTEVHVSQVMNGTAMMMPAGPVTIPARGSVAFKAGGLHLMIMGLTARLKDGAMQDVVLKFQRAGPVTARFHVRARIDAAPASQGHAGH